MQPFHSVGLRTFREPRGHINVDTFTVTLNQGEVLLDAVLRAGAALAHDCGGKLACATCCVLVRDGGEALSPPSHDELDMLDRSGAAEDGARLACQAAGAGEVVVGIPRTDTSPTHGAVLPIAVTVDAAQFLAVQLRKHPGALAMRLSIAPAGCSGFRYRVDAIKTVAANDTVFECSGVRVAVDPVSLPFVQGTTVRLAQEGLARRLRFDNPNARQSCGT
jgi:iron-sulfur cluster assembly protein